MFQLPPNLLAHVTLSGKPRPSQGAKKGWKGKYYNPLTPYIWGKKWEVKAQFSESPYPGAVVVYMKCFFPIPKSWTKAQKEKAMDETIIHAIKPDKDNLEKTYYDIIKKIIITDDARIWRGTTDKYYSPNPRTEIYIYYAE